MDKSFLDLGYSHASRKTLTLVDLDVHVWGLEECANSTLPIGVVVSWVAMGIVGKLIPVRNSRPV